ncbi:transposase, partial [Providencia stuartii]|uniref:transposase n=1 Tax=Providencia stuartii TaxID=588 RepID=UPI001954A38C
KDFLLGLKNRGLRDVEFVVADDHAGLRGALREVLAEAKADLTQWIAKWQAKYARLVDWAEETISFYRLPRQHHKHMKSTSMLERLNEEIK